MKFIFKATPVTGIGSGYDIEAEKIELIDGVILFWSKHKICAILPACDFIVYRVKED